MSKFADKLRALNIYNNHDILKRFGKHGHDVYVDYDKAESRGRCSHSTVYSPSHKTDPQSAWYDYGNKSFVGNRKESLPKAMEWASDKYGIAEWAVSPFGGRIPQYVYDAAKEAVRSKS